MVDYREKKNCYLSKRISNRHQAYLSYGIITICKRIIVTVVKSYNLLCEKSYKTNCKNYLSTNVIITFNKITKTKA